MLLQQCIKIHNKEYNKFHNGKQDNGMHGITVATHTHLEHFDLAGTHIQTLHAWAGLHVGFDLAKMEEMAT